MSKVGWGAILSALLILPALYGALGMVHRFDYPWFFFIGTFAVLNGILAYCFSKRTLVDFVTVFMGYVLTSFLSAVILGTLLFLLGLHQGWISFGKIGG